MELPNRRQLDVRVSCFGLTTQVTVDTLHDYARVIGPISTLKTFSAPWGVYSATLAVKHNIHLYPHMNPFLFRGDEKHYMRNIVVKCLV